MNTAEIASLMASLVSIGLGILAIWLSVVFYKMSSQLSESTKEAAKNIGASVVKLENLFDKLYSDTFSMMRDTVSDMRKHLWPDVTKIENNEIAKEAEQKADQKIEELKDKIESEISQLVDKQSSAESMITDIRELIDEAIKETRKVEVAAREETLREHIVKELKELLSLYGQVEAMKFVEMVEDKTKRTRDEILNELYKMRTEKLIMWDGEMLLPKRLIFPGKCYSPRG